MIQPASLQPATLSMPEHAVGSGSPRTVLMCRPQFFDVTYRINPWMEPDTSVDVSKALLQWEDLRSTYLDLGFTVRLIDPAPGLPDMVFTANGGFVLDGVALGTHFAHPQRTGEESLFLDWFAAQGYRCIRPEFVSEGEGDILLAGNRILAGYGTRSDPRSHREITQAFGREVISLELVDPLFYHLDTALAVLDPGTQDLARAQIAFYPGAFTARSTARLRQLFPTAIEVSRADALEFGLNAFSDGHHVVTSASATGFLTQLAAHGFVPVPVDLGELRRGGGSIKCCTLELRS